MEKLKYQCCPHGGSVHSCGEDGGSGVFWDLLCFSSMGVRDGSMGVCVMSQCECFKQDSTLSTFIRAQNFGCKQLRRIVRIFFKSRLV